MVFVADGLGSDEGEPVHLAEAAGGGHGGGQLGLQLTLVLPQALGDPADPVLSFPVVEHVSGGLDADR